MFPVLGRLYSIQNSRTIKRSPAVYLGGSARWQVRRMRRTLCQVHDQSLRRIRDCDLLDQRLSLELPGKISKRLSAHHRRKRRKRNGRRAAIAPVTGYARHVDKLMWLKSTVKDLDNNSITSESQLQTREGLWGSSAEQTDEPMYKNAIGGADGGRAGPGSRSPTGQSGSVNGAVVSGKRINLSGEVSIGGPAGL